MRDAFTLIEVMIASALGSVMIVTATTAFSVCAQSVTIGTHMSLNNSLLRAGYFHAMRDLDYWTTIDDPAAPTKPLRAVAIDGAYWSYGGSDPAVKAWGLPFTPFKNTMTFGRTDQSGVTGREDETGWDGSDLAWSAHDPRTWFWGNPTERDNGDAPAGYYALSSARLTQVDLGSYGTIAPRHRWFGNQECALAAALGFYGATAYMPSNAFWGWYEQPHGASDGSNSASGMCSYPVRVGNADDWYGTMGVMSTWNSNIHYPHSVGMLTSGGGYPVPSPDARSPDGTAAIDLFQMSHCAVYWSVYGWLWGGGTAGLHNYLLNISSVDGTLNPQRPAHWSALRSQVQRYMLGARPINRIVLTLSDPLDGKVWDVSFTSMGTTLRGARQQRHRDGGWARWDNQALGTSDPTLDSP